MARKGQILFLLLILTQAAHSVEEHSTRMYETFAPARFVAGMFSSNLPLGFILFNATLVAFGLWCWAFPVRLNWPSAKGFAWFWIMLELGNAIGHSALALYYRGYFPGLATAPALLLFSLWLAFAIAPAPAALQR